MHKPSTKLCNRLYSISSAGFARLTAKAITSDFQYDVTDITLEMINAKTVPITGFPSTSPAADPTATKITTKLKIRKTVRRLFEAIRSFIFCQSFRN